MEQSRAVPLQPMRIGIVGATGQVGGVMRRMRAAPKAIGCQRQHANEPADPIVGRPMFEKRAVAAVVLDKKQAHEKAGCRYRHR